MTRHEWSERVAGKVREMLPEALKSVYLTIDGTPEDFTVFASIPGTDVPLVSGFNEVTTSMNPMTVEMLLDDVEFINTL